MSFLLEQFEHLVEFLAEDGSLYCLWMTSLLYASMAGCVMYAATAVLQKFLGRRIAARYWFLLWMLVGVRLLMPFAPPSFLSVHQFWQSRPIQEVEQSAQGENRIVQTGILPSPVLRWMLNESESGANTSAGEVPYSGEPTPGGNREGFFVTLVTGLTFWLVGLLFIVWPLGTIVHVLSQVWRTAKFQGRLQGLVASGDVRLVNLLTAAQGECGIDREIRVILVPRLSSPAQVGLRSPSILLPDDVARDFSDQELRQIFLHELAHIQRRDAWWNLLLTLLQAVYWWNPMFWALRRKLHQERELACDASVLRIIGPKESASYGETLLKIVERLTTTGRTVVPFTVPGLFGSFERTSGLKRRLRALGDAGREKSRVAQICASLVIGTAALTGLTDAAPIISPMQVLHLTVPSDAVWKDASDGEDPSEQVETQTYPAEKLLDHIYDTLQRESSWISVEAKNGVRDSTRAFVVDKYLIPSGVISSGNAVRWEGDDLVIQSTESQWARIHRSLEQLLESDFKQITTEVQLISTTLDLIKLEGIRGGNVFMSSGTGEEIPDSFGLSPRQPGRSVFIKSVEESVRERLVNRAQGDTRTSLMFAPKVTSFSGVPVVVADTIQRAFVTGWKGSRSGQGGIVETLVEGTQLGVLVRTDPGSRELQVSMKLLLSNLTDVKRVEYADSRPEVKGTVVQLPQVERLSCEFASAVAPEMTLLVHPLTPVHDGGQRLYLLVRCRRVD